MGFNFIMTSGSIKAFRDRSGEEVKPDVLMSGDKTRWVKSGERSYMAVGATQEKLDAGFYDLHMPNPGTVVFQKKTLLTDDLIRPKEGIMEDILEEIETFWTKGDVFKENGFLHRRGYLLHGPPGSGKTALSLLIINDIINRGGVVLNGSYPSILQKAISDFREIEPDRPIICLYEDIDAIIEYQGESDVLAILDGEDQTDKVLNIATTNYPEKLDKRIVNRPRRFDRILRIGMPDESLRRQYLEYKLDLAPEEMEEWLEKSDGFSFAALSDLIVSTKCFGYSLEEAAARVRGTLFSKKDSEGYEKDFRQEPNTVGFGN